MRDYFRSTVVEAAETELETAILEGITKHESAVRWCVYDSASQLKQNLDVVEAGPSTKF